MRAASALPSDVVGVRSSQHPIGTTAAGAELAAVKRRQLEIDDKLAELNSQNEINVLLTDELEFLRELGANEVINYEEQKFEEVVKDVDLVIDTVGGDVFERSRLVLSPAGMLISVVEMVVPEQPADRPCELFFIVEPNRAELIELGRLIDAGKIKTAIAEVFPLEQAAKAFEKGLAGHVRGKIVLRVASDAQSSARA